MKPCFEREIAMAYPSIASMFPGNVNASILKISSVFFTA